MYDYIVRGVEGTRMVVVEESGCSVWPLGLHVNETRWFSQRTLGTKDNAIFVVGSSICHVIAFWTADLIACKVRWGKELNLSYDDSFVTGCDCIRRKVVYLIRSHEKGVRWGMKYAGLVEIGRSSIIYEELEGRRRTEYGEERVMVDEERPRLRSGRRDQVLLPQSFGSPVDALGFLRIGCPLLLSRIRDCG